MKNKVSDKVTTSLLELLLNMLDERGWTAMMVAIVHGSLDCLRENKQHFDYAMGRIGQTYLDVWVSLAKHFNHQLLSDIAEMTDNVQKVEDVQKKNKRVRKEKIC